MNARIRKTMRLAAALLLLGSALPASAAVARTARVPRLAASISRLIPIAPAISRALMSRPAGGVLELERPAASGAAAPALEATRLPAPAILGALRAAAPSPAAPRALQPEIERLNELGEVRVYFGAAPGFGHQTATLSLVRRLRELGYQGKIDAVFDGDHTYSIDGIGPEAKLAELLPGFDPMNRGRQRIKGLDMTIQSKRRHLQLSQPRPSLVDVLLGRPGKPRAGRVALALTGGADRMRDRQIEELGADTFLRLGPMGWSGHYEDQVWRDRAVKLVGGDDKRALIYEPAGEDAVDDAYFARLDPATHGAERLRGMAALARKTREADVLPVYGLAFMDGQMLYRTALAVSQALDERPELFRGKGVILPLLHDGTKAPNGFESLARSAPSHKDPAIREMARRLDRRLIVASIADPDIEEIMSELRPDQILVLRTGSVPPTFFEWLFRMSTLPPTLEGMNGRNLARLLGKPFIPVRDDAADYFQKLMRGPDAAHLRLMIHSAYKGLWGQPGTWAPGVRALTEYIVAAMSPESELSRQARASQLESTDYGKDKLLAGLRAALLP